MMNDILMLCDRHKYRAKLTDKTYNDLKDVEYRGKKIFDNKLHYVKGLRFNFEGELIEVWIEFLGISECFKSSDVVLLQSTGLRDLFNGDIFDAKIKLPHRMTKWENYGRYEVFWSDKWLQWKAKNIETGEVKRLSDFDNKYYRCVVVGNKYTNGGE